MLDLRCFFAGRGDDGRFTTAALVATTVVVRERFNDGDLDADGGISSFLVESSPYWNLAICPLKDADGGEGGMPAWSESSFSLKGDVEMTAFVCIDRVLGMLIVLATSQVMYELTR